MRISVKSDRDEEWRQDGLCISYKPSRLNRTEEGKERSKLFYEMSFTYDFRNKDDTVYFAYCLPYTYSKLQSFVKSLHRLPNASSFLREDHFTSSLTGVSLPILTITSHVEKCPTKKEQQGAPVELDKSDFTGAEEQAPPHRYKKYAIICARVHPGESNSSFIMHGFLEFITSQAPEAIDLRKRLIFKVVPMINPDGVIAGNYRTSLSGNDLNRQFVSPSPKLHPEITAIKTLVSQICYKAQEQEPIQAYIDIHGHSRKKSIFIYGPEYQLQSDKYFRSRVLPKLLDENSEMFRFHSCKFNVEPLKTRAARVVFNKEFGIMNCFTMEASMYGYIAKDRRT